MASKLETALIDLNLLRQMVAGLQKDGFIEISLYDLLTYLIPVTTEKDAQEEDKD